MVEDKYTSACLLNYNSFRDYHKIRAIDLSKQPALDVDPKPMKQINSSGNLDHSQRSKRN